MEARLRYQDKVVIVTGGSKGIGEGIVREFGELKPLRKLNSVFSLGIPLNICTKAQQDIK
jgi:hypothetical protein